MIELKEEKQKLLEKLDEMIDGKYQEIDRITNELQNPEIAGYLQPEFIRCGKKGCKCSKGELHGSYWYLYQYDSKKASKINKTYICPTKKPTQRLTEIQKGIENKRSNDLLRKRISEIRDEIQKIAKVKNKVEIELGKVF